MFAIFDTSKSMDQSMFNSRSLVSLDMVYQQQMDRNKRLDKIESGPGNYDIIFVFLVLPCGILL